MSKHTDQLIETFNNTFPVGSPCPWRSVGQEGVEHQQMIVRTKAFESNGQAVAYFEGKAGYCSIDPMFVDYANGVF